MSNYYVYILTNANRKVLYTGITNDLCRRLTEHCEAMEGSFTKKYNACYLIYYEVYGDVNDAIAREKEIKGWRRSRKVELIHEFNPEWRFLNDEVSGVGFS